MAAATAVKLFLCFVFLHLSWLGDALPAGRGFSADLADTAGRRLIMTNGRDESIRQLRNSLQNEIADWGKRLKDLSRKEAINDVHVVTETAEQQQCQLTPSERLNCGTFGIREADCLERGCCWLQTEEVDVPWCFHSRQALNRECSTAEETRVECGSYGIRQTACVELGCCWRPTSTEGTPWCYHQQATNTPVNVNNENVDNSPAAPPAPTCGVPANAPNVNARVVGGVEAREHSWPWMASLQGDGGHFCGGSLINSQWVLSAAHCSVGFQYSTRREVVLGLHRQSRPDSAALRVKVIGVFPSEKYGRPGKGMGNDVMLLKLEHPVNFTDAISPICLPVPFTKIPGGRRCFSTGWGALEAGGSSPDVLMQVLLPIIDNEVCNQAGWYDGVIDDTMVCAGYQQGGRDTCQGDSGGPLVCYNDDAWVLYGVVSWGYGCAATNHPGLYGRVSPYLRWMNKKMADNAN